MTDPNNVFLIDEVKRKTKRDVKRRRHHRRRHQHASSSR